MNFISSFLKTVLEWIYALVGNYGWSVILFTVLIRAVLLPLDVKSKRGMARHERGAAQDAGAAEEIRQR